MPVDWNHHYAELYELDNYIFLSCCHAVLLYLVARHQYDASSRSVSLLLGLLLLFFTNGSIDPKG